jgi:hypothetical protein
MLGADLLMLHLPRTLWSRLYWQVYGTMLTAWSCAVLPVL